MRVDPADARTRVSSLFEQCYAIFVRYACRRLSGLALAEGAVQESMMALYLQLTERGDVENPQAWVFCVLRRQLIRIHRIQSREDRAIRNWAGVNQPTEVGGAGQLGLEPGGWREQGLDGYLQILTDREAEVLLMRVRSLKYQEIAAELGIGVNTVKTLLARGLRKLRASARADAGPGLGELRDTDAHKQTLH
jgi:RNA polymerase sigma factor (sigma-70 family)